MICEQSKDLINNYLKYDYVGAPWESRLLPGWLSPYPSLLDKFNQTSKLKHEDGFSGNGGLSLRRKSKMLEILNNCPYIPGLAEDIYFSIGCKNISINKPSFELAKLFSIETIYSPNSFGIHKSWNYVSNISDNQCTNYNQLVELNTQESNIEEFNNIEDNFIINKIIIFIFIIIIIYIVYYKLISK
jgi:hypothetical protein